MCAHRNMFNGFYDCTEGCVRCLCLTERCMHCKQQKVFVAWLHDGDVCVSISTICVWTLCVCDTLSVGIVFGIHKNQCFLHLIWFMHLKIIHRKCIFCSLFDRRWTFLSRYSCIHLFSEYISFHICLINH